MNACLNRPIYIYIYFILSTRSPLSPPLLFVSPISLNEKKDLFAAYKDEQRDRERNLHREKELRDRRDFTALLCECPDLKGDTRFRDAEKLLEEDPRWARVGGREREDLFYDHVHELRQKLKESKR